MNTTTVGESTRDLAALDMLSAQSAVAAHLEEPWFFDEARANRLSSLPPPPPVPVGEFLGDPEVDAWLR